MLKKILSINLNKSLLFEEDQSMLSPRMRKILIILLIFVSIGSWVFYYNQGLTLAYNDARSRLNIARRVVDNLQPGLAQVGSVWLPLFHVLELATIWNYTLWQTGISGSVISMISYVLGGIFFLKLLEKMKFSKWITIFAFVIYAFNPNMVFMQALPMTEALLIFLAIASCYYLYKWAEASKPEDLIIGAFFIFLSTLTRYDGWFLLFFAALFVGLVSLKKKKDYQFASGHLFLFLTLAALGVVLWFLWNQLIFGDPLYFALGPFSAKSQQDVLNAEGRLFSKGNLVYSLFLYFIVVLYNTGIWIGLAATIGLFLIFKDNVINLKKKLTIVLLSVPFFFNVTSLYVGHSVIHIPYIEPNTWFNDRYGLMMLPAMAIGFAYVASRNKTTKILTSMMVIFQLVYMYIGNNIITIDDGIRGSSGSFLYEAGRWVGENAKDGLILVATSSNDAMVFTSGLPLKRFIVEGSGRYWRDSLADPTRHAKWVVMKDGDLVQKNLNDNEKFLNNYTLVYKDSFSYIYVRDEKRLAPLTAEELP